MSEDQVGSIVTPQVQQAAESVLPVLEQIKGSLKDPRLHAYAILQQEGRGPQHDLVYALYNFLLVAEKDAGVEHVPLGDGLFFNHKRADESARAC